MRKKSRIAIAALVIAIVGGLVWVAVCVRPAAPESVVDGKRMSEWVMDAFNSPGIQASHRNEAIKVLDETGTNAIPTLLRMESAHVPAWRLGLATVAQKLHFKYVKPVASNNVNNAALQAFRRLGPRAAVAVPELIRLYDARVSENSQNVAAFSLAAIGPAAKAAVPSLLGGTASTNWIIRNSAYVALGKIGADPKAVVPVLIKGLQETEETSSMHAAEALGEFGPDAQPAVPALVEFIRKEKQGPVSSVYGTNTRITALKALRKIDPETAAKIDAESKNETP